MADRAVIKSWDLWLFVQDHKGRGNKMPRRKVQIVSLFRYQVLMRIVRKERGELTRVGPDRKRQNSPGTHRGNDVTGPAKGTARTVYVFGVTPEAGCVRGERFNIRKRR